MDFLIEIALLVLLAVILLKIYRHAKRVSGRELEAVQEQKCQTKVKVPSSQPLSVALIVSSLGASIDHALLP